MRSPKAKPASALSHWVDETLPALDRRLLDELARNGVDDNWLRFVLGQYRSAQHVAKNISTRLAEADALAEIVAKLDAATVALSSIPFVARGMLSSLSVLHDIPWHQMRERLNHDLAQTRALLKKVEIDMRQRPAKRGRKPQRERDYLLRKVIDKLRSFGMKAAAARVLALRTLQACDIQAPSLDQKAPEKKAARAAKRVSR